MTYSEINKFLLGEMTYREYELFAEKLRNLFHPCRLNWEDGLVYAHCTERVFDKLELIFFGFHLGRTFI